MTTIALGHKSLQRRVGVVTLPSINIKKVYLLVGLLLLAALVFYVYSINMLTGGSYAIKNYNKEHY